jgi:hypothetical protein
VDDDLKTLGVRRWRKRAEDLEEWAIILKEAMLKLKELYAKEEQEDQVKKNEVVGMWHALERRKKCTRFWWESPKERVHSEDRSVDSMGSNGS